MRSILGVHKGLRPLWGSKCSAFEGHTPDCGAAGGYYRSLSLSCPAKRGIKGVTRENSTQQQHKMGPNVHDFQSSTEIIRE